MTTQRQADFIAAAYASGITSPKELANLMAQVSQESGGLTQVEEGFRYSGGLSTVPVRSARDSPDGPAAYREAMHGNPKPLAELMYGGKMGNDEPGDGYVYSDNLSGALVVRARENGLQRIDQVALSSDGQQLWAVQTPSGRDDHLFDLRTSLSTNTATTSLEQSSAQWPDAMQKFEMSQQAQQTLTPEQATQQAPNVVR